MHDATSIGTDSFCQRYNAIDLKILLKVCVSISQMVLGEFMPQTSLKLKFNVI